MVLMELEMAKIADFNREHKRMPSFGELQSLLGYKSKSAVNYFVQKLIDKGYIDKDGTGRLIPKNLGEVRVLGVDVPGLAEPGGPQMAGDLIVQDIGCRGTRQESRRSEVGAQGERCAGPDIGQ